MLNGRELSYYASLLGEVVASIALAIAIVILTIVLNPQLAHAGPVDDRWPKRYRRPNRFRGGKLTQCLGPRNKWRRHCGAA